MRQKLSFFLCKACCHATPGQSRQKPVSETGPVAAAVSSSSLTVPAMTTTTCRGYRIGYARVSTTGQNPQLQLDALAAAGVDQVFTEHASGVLSERPKLTELLAQIRPGDTLVVWRLDRLGRSTPHLLQTVTELGERGVGFSSLTEAIDTTTAAGRLMYGVMASLAAFERDLLRERTHAGLAAARARGHVGGRPPIMTADKLAVARALLAEGKSKSAVARTIGVSRPTLYAHLSQASIPTNAA